MQSRFLLWLLCLTISGRAASANHKSISSVSSDLTCPSRTVNYITHGLPQQCLPSSRQSSPSNARHSSILVNDAYGVASNSSQKSVRTSTTLSTSSKEAAYLQPSITVATSESSTRSIGSQSSEKSWSHVVQQPPKSQSPPPSVMQSDDGSALDDGDFLSYEEWKKRILRKAGQSEHVGRDLRNGQKEVKKRVPQNQNSLESLGDEAEIDIDFSGFVPDSAELANLRHPRGDEGDQVQIDSAKAPRPKSGSREAGTTSKERFNYASLDCAANVLKTNSHAKSASAVLGENKDSYMLNECSVKNKFIIVELCDDISIDTIVLANFEFFSSIFRTFKVSVSDRYPVKADKWKTLGTFEARNSRNAQAFLVENSVIWARYVRIEFLTHYGNEFYCPVSLIRVHGQTMMEEYKHDMSQLQFGGDDDEAEDGDGEGDEEAEADRQGSRSAEEVIVAEAVADNLETGDDRNQASSDPEEPDTFGIGKGTGDVINLKLETTVCDTYKETECRLYKDTCVVPSVFEHFGTCNIREKPKERVPIKSQSQIESSTSSAAPTQSLLSKSVSTSSSKLRSIMPISKSSSSVSTMNIKGRGSSTVSIPAASVQITASKSGGSSVQAERIRGSSASHVSPPVPTMQESFFKSVQKRLQMLEANSSLSLQYIEDQSRALRDAFVRVEQRQLSKTNTFLEYLNSTVLNELRDFRQQYDQLWQSTVIELEMQREQYQKENGAMNERLAILADELIFQKRMSIMQMFLILICLGLVLFSRTSMNNYMETPLAQSVLWRSPSFRNVESPSRSPLVRAKGSNAKARVKNGILKSHHRRPKSEESNDETLSQNEMFSPPTPVSFEDVSDTESLLKDTPSPEPPVFDPSDIERPSTSPPVLTGETMINPALLYDETPQDSIETRLLKDAETPTGLGFEAPRILFEEATPPVKHLKWKLPDV